METALLQKLLLRLLDKKIYKTTAQLVEEFRMEYPAQWHLLQSEGEMLYGKSCSSIQQPTTRITQALISLPAYSCQRQYKNGQYYWSEPAT